MSSIAKRIPKLAGLAAALVSAACAADQGTSPTATTVDAAPRVVAAEAPSIVRAQALAAPEVERPASLDPYAFLSVTEASVSYLFTVDPTRTQSFLFGTHMVRFPAYSICNPATSGYGPSTWQTNCVKATSPITMVATTWVDPLGRARIDFDAEIRFFSNMYGQLPAIYLMDPAASLSDYARIDYCHTDDACVDEAASDPVLQTKRDPWTGYLYRIIRHFSGYNVWA